MRAAAEIDPARVAEAKANLLMDRPRPSRSAAQRVLEACRSEIEIAIQTKSWPEVVADLEPLATFKPNTLAKTWRRIIDAQPASPDAPGTPVHRERLVNEVIEAAGLADLFQVPDELAKRLGLETHRLLIDPTEAVGYLTALRVYSVVEKVIRLRAGLGG
jgi:hypothetical protein